MKLNRIPAQLVRQLVGMGLRTILVLVFSAATGLAFMFALAPELAWVVLPIYFSFFLMAERTRLKELELDYERDDRAFEIWEVAGRYQIRTRAAFAGYVLGGLRDGGLAFLGTGVILTGCFFFGFTLGYWDWSEMAGLAKTPYDLLK